MLKLDRLSVRYGAVEALMDVSLLAPAGKVTTIIGANGAGKTTLLMSITGNPAPCGGRIFFEDHDITGISPEHVSALGIGIVPEGRRIFTRMSVRENLLLGGLALPPAANRNGIERAVHMFPILGQRLLQRAGTLSGGEQQMLAIARALMRQPRLLLLDEPSLGLAPLLVQQIFATLRHLHAEGMTILLVEQNAHQALRLADQAYVLANGRLALSGTGQELARNPEIRRAYLAGD